MTTIVKRKFSIEENSRLVNTDFLALSCCARINNASPMSILPKLLPINATTREALDGVARIYAASIPASERKPLEAIRQMADRPDYRLIAAADDTDRVIGFAAVFVPADETFALLEYLAVDESTRGRGMGAALFAGAVEALGAESRPRSVLVEVDADLPDAPDHEIRVRRQAFYRRLGCRRMADLDYELPLRAAGLPPPMHLFVHHRENDAPVRRTNLARALRKIYTDVYGQPADDPRIGRMLARVTDPVLLD
jgi:ribosomal protein S18 acetylase RimI-like enzyme